MSPSWRSAEIRFLYVLLGVGLPLNSLSTVYGGCLAPPISLPFVMDDDLIDEELAVAHAAPKKKRKPRLSAVEALSTEGNTPAWQRYD